jgi:hypothetical protein
MSSAGSRVPEGRLVVARTSGRDLKMRGVELLVDDDFVGSLQYGETFEASIAPGRHTLVATNRMYSPSMEFDIAPGETVRFSVTSVALGGLWLFVAMMGTVAYRVVLERTA